MLKGFKEFIMRGNVIDLAVAVVIATAFTTVVTALVDSLITPLIAAIFGEPNLDAVLNFTINGAEFSIGAILTALVNFVLVALAVYVVLVMPMNKLRQSRAAGGQDEPEEPSQDVVLLQEIRDLLRDRSGHA